MTPTDSSRLRWGDADGARPVRVGRRLDRSGGAMATAPVPFAPGDVWSALVGR